MASLSDPVELPCGLILPNRFIKAAMAEELADYSNIPNEKFKKVYGKWAEGGWGMIITGNVQVDPAHLGQPGDLSVDSSRLSDQLYIKHWKEWAQSCKSPTIVQINHPGRQSPAGAGSRGFFRKTVAPSPVALDFGSGLVQTLLRQLIFGTPRELTTHEVTEVINQFVVAAKHVYDSGFDGVEIHAAHGYLLAQFLSTQTNQRSDEFGGSAYDRAEIIVRIVRGIRVATSPSFCIGMKLNSVDASQSGGSNEDFVEQLKRFGDAGIDFLEISGGTYETPDMAQHSAKSARAAQREAFFLKFASLIRSDFPSLLLIVTGGFRSFSAMNEAISTKQCDFIGLARPAALNPYIPKTLLASKEDSARVEAPKIEMNWMMKLVPIRSVGAGVENRWYGDKIRKMGK